MLEDNSILLINDSALGRLLMINEGREWIKLHLRYKFFANVTRYSNTTVTNHASIQPFYHPNSQVKAYTPRLPMASYVSYA